MVNIRLAVYSAAHLLVDLSCALLLLGRVCPQTDPAVCLLLYNFFAFAVQMPLGLLADGLGRGGTLSAVGCLLTLTGWLLPPSLPAAVTAGLGNALFHVGGGLSVLNQSGGHAGPLGIFVSPGAIGIYLGSLWAGQAAELSVPVCLALLLTAGSLLYLRRERAVPPPTALPKSWGATTALAGLLAVVVLRSWVGLAADLPWKGAVGPLAVCAAVIGKAAGGILADRFGPGPTASFSLLLAALCFAGAGGPVPGLTALLLFHMTMPLTLWAAAQLLPGHQAFAFGLLTFGLFLGSLPTALGGGTLSPAGLSTAALLSLPPLLWGLSRKAEEDGAPC